MKKAGVYYWMTPEKRCPHGYGWFVTRHPCNCGLSAPARAGKPIDDFPGWYYCDCVTMEGGCSRPYTAQEVPALLAELALLGNLPYSCLCSVVGINEV